MMTGVRGFHMEAVETRIRRIELQGLGDANWMDRAR